jgi:hypothetical protein
VEASPTLDIDQTKLNDISEYSDGQLRSPRGAQTPASPHTRLPPVLPNRQVCARTPCRFGSTAARFLRGSLSLGVFAARGGCFRRPALLDASVVVSRSKCCICPSHIQRDRPGGDLKAPLLILPILCESERENPPRHDAACGPSAKPTATAPCRRQRGADQPRSCARVPRARGLLAGSTPQHRRHPARRTRRRQLERKRWLLRSQVYEAVIMSAPKESRPARPCARTRATWQHASCGWTLSL